MTCTAGHVMVKISDQKGMDMAVEQAHFQLNVAQFQLIRTDLMWRVEKKMMLLYCESFEDS